MTTILEPHSAARLRHGFRRYLNPFMLALWRLGLGPWFNWWPQVSGRVMVIAHTGRRTGARRYAPVNYAEVDGELYCVAGFGAVSDWYRNVMADPNVEVWLPDGWWAGTLEDVSASGQRAQLMRAVLIGSGFAARVFGLNPRTLSDETLRSLTGEYRLLRVHRTAARTGPGGPGDLAWVWPVLVMILLPLALWRRGRK